jgi:hypothetical protein
MEQLFHTLPIVYSQNYFFPYTFSPPYCTMYMYNCTMYMYIVHIRYQYICSSCAFTLGSVRTVIAMMDIFYITVYMCNSYAWIYCTLYMRKVLTCTLNIHIYCMYIVHLYSVHVLYMFKFFSHI